MCDVCGMQYVGQTNNIRLRMDGHNSDYRKFLNGDFSNSDTSSLHSHIRSHDVKIFKFQILKFLKMKVLNILKKFENWKLDLTLKSVIVYGNWKL